MGLVPHDKLVKDGAPFVAAFQTMFGTPPGSARASPSSP
jgi:hypothetical protein